MWLLKTTSPATKTPSPCYLIRARASKVQQFFLLSVLLSGSRAIYLLSSRGFRHFNRGRVSSRSLSTPPCHQQCHQPKCHQQRWQQPKKSSSYCQLGASISGSPDLFQPRLGGRYLATWLKQIAIFCRYILLSNLSHCIVANRVVPAFTHFLSDPCIITLQYYRVFL